MTWQTVQVRSELEVGQSFAGCEWLTIESRRAVGFVFSRGRTAAGAVVGEGRRDEKLEGI